MCAACARRECGAAVAKAYRGPVSDHRWTPPDPESFLRRWDLLPDGPAITTPSSHVIPVRYRGAPAMLKVPRILEERDGGRLMVWWAGRGAAPVLVHDDDAIVLERALGPHSLTCWALSDGPDGDERATQVLCAVAGELHATGRAVGLARTGGAVGVGGAAGASGAAGTANDAPPEGLVTLERWFADLLAGTAGHEGFLGRAAVTARALLDDQREVVTLHGDIHHGNVLDFGDERAARWRAIDPKFLVGDRAFDYANIVCNPSHDVARTPGRLARQVSVICAAAGLDRARLLRWIVAWTGLSATWYLGDTWLPRAEREAAAAAVLGVGQDALALLEGRGV